MTTLDPTRAELREWRLLHGLTQAALASALGISWSTVIRWETGVQKPPPFLFLALRELERQLNEEETAS
jgi:DNA-binding XRE family transcriptional regulator